MDAIEAGERGDRRAVDLSSGLRTCGKFGIRPYGPNAYPVVVTVTKPDLRLPTSTIALRCPGRVMTFDETVFRILALYDLPWEEAPQRGFD